MRIPTSVAMLLRVVRGRTPATRHLREVVLAHVQLYAQVVQVGDGDHVAFGPAVADEAGGDELTHLDVALEHRGGNRRADHGVAEVRAVAHELAAGGAQRCFGGFARLDRLV